MAARTGSLVAFAHVADVPRSIAFYADLGFRVLNQVVPPQGGPPFWAWLRSGDANLMVNQASGPVDAGQQAVMFYLYFEDIRATREELLRLGHAVGEIRHPFYLPKGECRLEDPDGYVLMLAQHD